jgi:hypothetical protein
MNIKLFLICILSLITGIIIMLKNKFYKYETDDMLFATKLKVFLGGLLFSLIGIYGLINEILKL